MRKLVALSCLALAGAACAPARDDAGADRRADLRAPEIAQVTVDELDRMLASHQCVAVDANGDATRRRMGVIPGAVLLTDDAIDKLPRDRSQSLVFYCANEACRSSHEAATRAFLAGYTHVKVMPAGIAGWVRAGKQTSSI